MRTLPRTASALGLAVALALSGFVAAPAEASIGPAAVVSHTAVSKAAATAATKTKITAQPKSASIRGGARATFKVKAAGTKLRYQWYVKAAGKKSFKAIKGATKSSYTTAKQANKTLRAQYRVVVSGSRGKVTSRTATLSVKAYAATKITAQPKSASIRGGQSATFAVKASGEGLRYQWQVKAQGTSSYATITGATKPSYTTPKQGNKGASSAYRVVVTGKGGKATSAAASLKVTPWSKPTVGSSSTYRVEHANRARVTVSGTNFAGATVTVSSVTSQPAAMKLVGRTNTTLTFEVTRAGYVDLNQVRISNPAGSVTAEFLLMAKASVADHQNLVDWVVDLSDEQKYGPWHENVRTEAHYAISAIRGNVNRWALIDDIAVELLDAAIDYEDAPAGSAAESDAWHAVQEAYEELQAFLS